MDKNKNYRIIESPPIQFRKVFFNANEPPSRNEILKKVDRNNPECSFHKFVGNERAVSRLLRAAFNALNDPYHSAASQNYALLGPASTGKTTLAKYFADLLEIPFVEIEPASVKTLTDLVRKIAQVCENTKIHYDDKIYTLELVPGFYDEDKPNGLPFFLLPPMIIFIDEVHNLNNKMVQGLLKATEKKDKTLVIESGEIFRCDNVCWMIATTDLGLLFDAFVTRFTKIYLNYYTFDEIVKIVKFNNSDWNDDVCKIVARYGGKVIREVLDFATEMRLEKEMNPDKSWEETAKIVALDQEIDEFGMSKRRLKILIALYKSGHIAKNRLGDSIGCKQEELERFVLPPMLAEIEDQQPLVKITNKGCCLTEFGLKEIEKRVKILRKRKGGNEETNYK